MFIKKADFFCKYVILVEYAISFAKMTTIDCIYRDFSLSQIRGKYENNVMIIHKAEL